MADVIGAIATVGMVAGVTAKPHFTGAPQVGVPVIS